MSCFGVCIRGLVLVLETESRLTGTGERPIMRLVRESGRHRDRTDRKSEVEDQ
jgi:hypothetical protein